MPALNQGAWVPGTSNYEYGYNSIPTIPITGAPADANFNRWGMLHDGQAYRLYAFKGSTRDTFYQFAFDGTSYAYAHNGSIPVLTLAGMPADADPSSISFLHEGGTYHAYVRRLGEPTTLYQFVWVPGTTTYQWGYGPYLPTLTATGYPADTDWSRWMMLHDGTSYRLYAFHYATPGVISQGSWDGNTYAYGHNSIPQLNLVNYPADSDLGRVAMLHDGLAYRLYFQTLTP